MSRWAPHSFGGQLSGCPRWDILLPFRPGVFHLEMLPKIVLLGGDYIYCESQSSVLSPGLYFWGFRSSGIGLGISQISGFSQEGARATSSSLHHHHRATLAPCLAFTLGFTWVCVFGSPSMWVTYWSLDHQTFTACSVGATVLGTYEDDSDTGPSLWRAAV